MKTRISVPTPVWSSLSDLEKVVRSRDETESHLIREQLAEAQRLATELDAKIHRLEQ